MRHLGLVATLLLSVPALAQDPGTQADTSVKVDVGTVRSVDAQRQILVCDLPDGQVTYNIAGAQVIDATGAALGAASAANLPPGQRVRVQYTVQPNFQSPDHGAHATEVRIAPQGSPKS